MASKEEIESEVARVQGELRDLLSMPLRFQVHGQTVDNTERVALLKKRLVELRAALEGRSAMQGPDLVV